MKRLTGMRLLASLAFAASLLSGCDMMGEPKQEKSKAVQGDDGNTYILD